MGRRKEFCDQTLFAAIGADIALGNGGALKALSERTGISIGSIYHRFGCREGLLAEAWVWAVSEFQEQFLAGLHMEGEAAGLEAALATPWFCRNKQGAAIILAGCRASEFLGPKTPVAVQAKLDLMTANLAREMGAFSNYTGHPLALCRFALIDMPLASVRAYMPHKQVPEEAEKYVATAYRALMRFGD